MREIKFRVWNIKDKKWQQYQEWGEAEVNANSSESGIYELHNDKFFIWLQYTGIKDKNGKEIYEGDIIRRTQIKNVLGEKTGHRYKIVKYIISKVRNGFNVCLNQTWEVIGNIYEDKNLLNN